MLDLDVLTPALLFNTLQWMTFP